MGWDTDKTDIDLHVHEPDKTHVYYGNRISVNGGYLSRDFREGYGPECYLIRRAPKGTFHVSAHYFGSHQVSAATGATSAVLWCVKRMGDVEREEVEFKMVRLNSSKNEMKVTSVVID
jgi:uncharacterized protein YfaP (DUF2135 family)